MSLAILVPGVFRQTGRQLVCVLAALCLVVEKATLLEPILPFVGSTRSSSLAPGCVVMVTYCWLEASNCHQTCELGLIEVLCIIVDCNLTLVTTTFAHKLSRS